MGPRHALLLMTLAFLALAVGVMRTQAATQQDVTTLIVEVNQVDGAVQLVPTDKDTISAEVNGKEVPVSIDEDTATATVNLQQQSNGKSKKTPSNKPHRSNGHKNNGSGSNSAGVSSRTVSFVLTFVLAVVGAVFASTVYGRRSSSVLVTLAAVGCVLIACLTTTSEGDVNSTADITVFIPDYLNLISHQYYVVYTVIRGNHIIFYFFPLSRPLALVAATSPARLSNVAAGLSSVGFVVSTFDATTSTPTLDQIQAFKYVLVFSDPLHTFADKNTLGDVLARAYDARVRVVTATFANAAESPLGGRFGDASNGYLMLDPTISTSVSSAFLGATLEQDLYLLTGVTTFKAQQAYATSNSLVNGARAGISWSDARPLIAVGKVGKRRKTDINFFPVANSTTDPGLWVGDGWTLLRNAIAYNS